MLSCSVKYRMSTFSQEGQHLIWEKDGTSMAVHNNSQETRQKEEGKHFTVSEHLMQFQVFHLSFICFKTKNRHPDAEKRCKLLEELEDYSADKVAK